MTHKSIVGLNSKFQGLQQSATLVINERSQQLIEKGIKVYRLGFGQSPFPVPSPMVAALAKFANEKDYLPVKGLFALRETIAGYYNRTLNLKYDPDHIMISPGSKTLLFLVQLVSDGQLLLPSPSWVSYAPQGIISGRPVIWINTFEEDQWMLSAQSLEAHALKHKTEGSILVLNYPSNPTGSTYSESQLEALAIVARKYGIIILSDEIYGELHHEGQHISIAKYYPEGTIISSGLSKWAGAGGWRMGMFSFPPELKLLIRAVTIAASEIYTSTSAPIQYAAITAFTENPVIQKQVIDSRKILKFIGNYVHSCLDDLDVHCPKPEGGFYLFPNFSAYANALKTRGIDNSRQLCERLLEETGVALLPGSDFGRPASELSARLSYVDFDGAKALELASNEFESLPLDENFLKQSCPDIIQALNQLETWLKHD